MLFPSVDFNTIDYDSAIDQLKEYGLLVIENIITKTEADEILTQNLEILKLLGGGKLDLDNIKETWRDEDLPPQGKAGVFQSLLTHTPTYNKVRQDVRLRTVWSKIYSHVRQKTIGPDDILPSLDAQVLCPNGVGGVQTDFSNYADWAHLDQTTYTDEPFKCLQGQLVMSNTTAGFRCSTKSHKIFNEVTKQTDLKDIIEARTQSELWNGTVPEGANNFYMFDQKEIDTCKSLVEKAGGQWQIPVRVPAGSLIVWWSATIHSNLGPVRVEDPCVTDRWLGWRHVYYICFRPKEEFKDSVLSLRKESIEKNLTMNHWSTWNFGVRPVPGVIYNDYIQNLIEEPTRVFKVLDYTPNASADFQ